MTALNFVFSFFDTIINFVFNDFKMPDSNASLGWVLVVAISMFMMIHSILNLPKVAPHGKTVFNRKDNENGR